MVVSGGRPTAGERAAKQRDRIYMDEASEAEIEDYITLHQ
jgi:hypothetical protein